MRLLLPFRPLCLSLAMVLCTVEGHALGVYPSSEVIWRVMIAELAMLPRDVLWLAVCDDLAA